MDDVCTQTQRVSSRPPHFPVAMKSMNYDASNMNLYPVQPIVLTVQVLPWKNQSVRTWLKYVSASVWSGRNSYTGLPRVCLTSLFQIHLSFRSNNIRFYNCLKLSQSKWYFKFIPETQSLWFNNIIKLSLIRFTHNYPPTIYQNLQKCTTFIQQTFTPFKQLFKAFILNVHVSDRLSRFLQFKLPQKISHPKLQPTFLVPKSVSGSGPSFLSNEYYMFLAASI